MNYIITKQEKKEAYALLEELGFVKPEKQAPKLESVHAEGWTIESDFESVVFVITPEKNKRQLFNQQADEIIDALQDGFSSAWSVIDMISDFIDYEPLELAA